MNTKHIVILLLFSLLLALTACGSAETTPPPEVLDTAPIEIPQMVQDITVELGSAVAVSDFVIPGMNAADVSLSQGFTLSADAVGETAVSFVCSGETQAAKLTVIDTTAPILELHDVAMYTGEIPDAEVFVTACTDFAECTVVYEEEPDMSVFGEQVVVLVATDASGNEKKAEAVLTLYHLYAEVRLEYG